MKTHETKKLFYDRYPYKIVIRNSLGHIFRDKNWKFARDELDTLQLKYEKSETLSRGTYRIFTYDIPTFLHAKNLFTFFTNTNVEFKLRVENPNIQVYSCDYNFLQRLQKLGEVVEFWEPTVQLHPNTIISNNPVTHSIKVTLDNDVSPSLATWIIKNPKLAKAGKTCLEEIRNNGYTKGFYIYVRDERVLSVVTLMLGKILRVDKIVYSENLDK